MFAISGTKLDIGYEERLILKDFDMTVRKGKSQLSLVLMDQANPPF